MERGGEQKKKKVLDKNAGKGGKRSRKSGGKGKMVWCNEMLVQNGRNEKRGTPFLHSTKGGGGQKAVKGPPAIRSDGDLIYFLAV